ncbi:MAG: glycosyl transferase family protein [Candidatus Levybacteria bacterium]|nr:glycosyl transferase family protein [Candidatus Levybacteria bacterium]
MQAKTSNLISCIVPYYNDNNHVASVLEILTQVKNIAQIICIDDGSADPSTAEKIKAQFPMIEVIRREKNSGKSEAVKFALSHVTTPYVLLFDADIINVIPSEIEHILNFIYDDPSIDLLILKRVEPWYIRLFRWDKLLAGERVMRTEDLRKIFLDNPPSGYQLEYATNSYMMRNHKKVYWAAYSGMNVFKSKKIGFFRGVVRDTMIHYDFVKYKGILFAIQSTLFFCRKKYENKNISIK